MKAGLRNQMKKSCEEKDWYYRWAVYIRPGVRTRIVVLKADWRSWLSTRELLIIQSKIPS